jgi:hypothetical protein
MVRASFGIHALALLAVLVVRSDSSPSLMRKKGHPLHQPGMGKMGFGHAKPAENFDEEVSKHFTKSNKPSYAKRRAKKQNKPLLVLLTRNGCGACQNLKQSVNRGTEVKKLLEKFVVVHAENKHCAQWQLEGHGYAPQTMFFPPGEDNPLPIHGGSSCLNTLATPRPACSLLICRQ